MRGELRAKKLGFLDAITSWMLAEDVWLQGQTQRTVYYSQQSNSQRISIFFHPVPSSHRSA